MFARATALSLSLSFGLLAFGESAYVLSYFNDLAEGGRRGEAGHNHPTSMILQLQPLLNLNQTTTQPQHSPL